MTPERSTQLLGDSIMSLSKKQVPDAVRQADLMKLQKRMQVLRNEMDFVEILVQFWPLPNMSDKMERLQDNLGSMNRQYLEFSGLNADQAGSLPFRKVSI
jgi:hypothetical protein